VSGRLSVGAARAVLPLGQPDTSRMKARVALTWVNLRVLSGGVRPRYGRAMANNARSGTFGEALGPRQPVLGSVLGRSDLAARQLCRNLIAQASIVRVTYKARTRRVRWNSGVALDQ
jgi:hypothetical protein